MNEPPINPYIKLKERILGEFEPTSAAKIRKVLKSCKLGDRKPSVLLCKMRQLSSDRINYDVLRKVFCGALPEMVRTIFLTTRITDLDTAAEAADKVHEDKYVAIHTMTSSTADTSSREASINALVKSVDDKTHLINGPSQIVCDHSRNRNRVIVDSVIARVRHTGNLVLNVDMKNVTIIINSAIIRRSVLKNGARNIYHSLKNTLVVRETKNRVDYSC